MKKKSTSRKTTKSTAETRTFWEQEVEVGEIPYGDGAKHVFTI